MLSRARVRWTSLRKTGCHRVQTATWLLKRSRPQGSLTELEKSRLPSPPSGSSESASSLDPFRRRMLTLPYRPIIVYAECISNQAPGVTVGSHWASNATPIHNEALHCIVLGRIFKAKSFVQK